MRHWTEEDRKRQSDLIRARKPWLRSTGPRTAAGKKISSMNAYKTGNRSAVMRRIRVLLRRQRLRLALFIAQSNAQHAARKRRFLDGDAASIAPVINSSPTHERNRVFPQTNYYHGDTEIIAQVA